MAGILKSLLGKNRNQPAAEEIEALARANHYLRYRVEQMTKSSAAAA
jgi:hypothetical protein